MLNLHNAKEEYEAPEWLKPYTKGNKICIMDSMGAVVIYNNTLYNPNLELSGSFTVEQLKDLIAFAEAHK